jgi:hypothetical protein
MDSRKAYFAMPALSVEPVAPLIVNSSRIEEGKPSLIKHSSQYEK